MKLNLRLQQIAYALFVVVLGYFSIGFFIMNYGDPLYMAGFSSNLLATLFGVAAGLPAALYLDRLINSRREEQEDSRRAEQQISQLQLIKEELIVAGANITIRRDRGEVVLPPLNSQLWQTMQGSKRLREVKDLRVIAQIGDAYNRISAHQELEMQFHSLEHVQGPRAEHIHDPQKHILTDLRNMDEATLESIAEAVGDINAYIKSYG